MIRLIMVLLMAVVAATGCKQGDSANNQVCTESIDPGVVLEVRDAVTNEPIADSATAILSSATYSEHMVICLVDGNGRGISLCGAYERAGTYDIAVSVSGYQPWNTSGVVVAPAICHVATVHLIAQMSKDPSSGI